MNGHNPYSYKRLQIVDIDANTLLVAPSGRSPRPPLPAPLPLLTTCRTRTDPYRHPLA